MINVEESITINRTPAEVFSLVGDQTNAPRWQRGLDSVRRLGDGPIGVGTRHEFVRTMMGRRMSGENEYTQFEPDRYVAFEATSGGWPLEASYEVEPAGERATRLIARIALQPSGRVPRPPAPVRRRPETGRADQPRRPQDPPRAQGRCRRSLRYDERGEEPRNQGGSARRLDGQFNATRRCEAPVGAGAVPRVATVEHDRHIRCPGLPGTDAAQGAAAPRPRTRGWVHAALTPVVLAALHTA